MVEPPETTPMLRSKAVKKIKRRCYSATQNRGEVTFHARLVRLNAGRNFRLNTLIVSIGVSPVTTHKMHNLLLLHWVRVSGTYLFLLCPNLVFRHLRHQRQLLHCRKSVGLGQWILSSSCPLRYGITSTLIDVCFISSVCRLFNPLDTILSISILFLVLLCRSRHLS